MKISNLTECTTAGAVATVAQPFETVQKRTPEKKLKGSNLLKGIKTSAKYANSLHEAAGEQSVAPGAKVNTPKGPGVIESSTPNRTLVKLDSGEVVGFHTEEVTEFVKEDKQSFTVGQKVEVHHGGAWVPATITAVDRPGKYKIRLSLNGKMVDYVSGAMNTRALTEETIHVGHRDSKGNWIKTSTHSNYADAKTAMQDLEKAGRKGVQHRYDNNGSIDPGGMTFADKLNTPDQGVAEGAKVDRMVGHVKSSEKKLGKSSKEAENIAWATANKRGMLDNKNKKVSEGEDWTSPIYDPDLQKGKKKPKLSDVKVKFPSKQQALKKKVAEGWDSTYIVSVIDTATGERNKIEVKVTSLEAAKKRAEAQGYKVLGVKEQGVAEGNDNEGREPMVGETCFIRNYNGHVVLQGLSGDKARVKFDNGRVEIVSRMDLLPQSEKVNSLWEGKGEKPATKEKPNPYAKSNPDTLANKKNKKVYKKKPEHNDYAQSDPDAGYDDNKIDEGRFVKGPGGVPLDRLGNAIQPKPQAEPKAPAVRRDANGLTRADYNTVWRKIEDVVGQIFPDGDPIDWLGPWLDRQGITGYRIGDILRKACQMNGFKDIYAYYDHFKTGDYGYEDPNLKGFLDNGGQVQHGSFKGPRKAEKTDYGSTHIGGPGDKMKASRTGLAAKTQGDKIVGLPEEKEKPATDDISSITDPELKHAMDKARTHYSGIKDPITAFRKLTVRGLKHAEEADIHQNEKLKELEQLVNRMKQEIFSLRQRGTAVAEGEINEEDLILTPGAGRKLKPGLLHKQEVSINPTDTVKVDVPLLIRLLEFAREDAKTDMDLHDLAEKLIAYGARGRTLTMKDYAQLVPEKAPEQPEMESRSSIMTGIMKIKE